MYHEYRCPECSNNRIIVTVTAAVIMIPLPDGSYATDAEEGNSVPDLDWDDTSPAKCAGCGHDGELGTFRHMLRPSRLSDSDLAGLLMELTQDPDELRPREHRQDCIDAMTEAARRLGAEDPAPLSITATIYRQDHDDLAELDRFDLVRWVTQELYRACDSRAFPDGMTELDLKAPSGEAVGQISVIFREEA